MVTSKAEQKPAPAHCDTLPTQIGLTMSVELGRAKISLDDALTYTEQSVIELDKLVGRTRQHSYEWDTVCPWRSDDDRPEIWCVGP